LLLIVTLFQINKQLYCDTMATSFVYEDLISKVQMIQNQMNNIQAILTDRWKTEKRKRDELKSRSLVFNDPYGNQTVIKHMDHEFIHNVINKYKEDYAPKYLQRWIKVGIMKDNIILPLNDYELKSNVSQFVDGFEFITYGEVISWIVSGENTLSKKLVLYARLIDNMDTIKMQINELRPFTNIELKSCTIRDNEKASEESWNEGTILKSEDTIISCRLYEDNCVMIGKISKEKVKHCLLFSDLT
jgi:hypothetical protein